ncbi:MAG: DEAD/DEAH box helicase [Bdellovibrionaceae bacterium]|nr:DEAD/DEAH box helicase [Pseudobdellovibrionaceae bacterium]
MEFSEWNLVPELNKNITDLGYKTPTPIQQQAVPVILNGQDLAGLAQTGTGKTAAFMLPLLDRIIRSQAGMTDEISTQRKFVDWKSNNFVLVLLPTRELAEQVFENFNGFTKDMNLKAISVYGGVGYDKQKSALRNGVQFIFATPGRLIDLYKEHLIDLRLVRAIVFDEADRMFDMGFKDDMKFILQRVPRERQFLVFSATLNLDVLNTAYQFGANPVEINISRDKATADNVKDKIYHVGDGEKPQILLSLLKKQNPKQAIIFTNFKNNVERVAHFLSENSFPAIAISSLMTQAQRTRVLEQFKAVNEKNILVATDIAARGLDIQGVDLVINFELPMDCETYVHRIGRTGRANAEGTALNLCSDRDLDSLNRIEEFLKRKIDQDYLESTDLIKEFVSFSDGRSHHHQGNGGGKPRGEFRGGGNKKRPEPRGGHRNQGRGQDRGEQQRTQSAGPRDANRDNRENNRERGPRPPRAEQNRGGQQGQKAAQHQNGEVAFKKESGSQQQNRPQNSGKYKNGKPNYSKGPKSYEKKSTPKGDAAKAGGLKQKVVGFFKKIFS